MIKESTFHVHEGYSNEILNLEQLFVTKVRMAELVPSIPQVFKHNISTTYERCHKTVYSTIIFCYKIISVSISLSA